MNAAEYMESGRDVREVHAMGDLPACPFCGGGAVKGMAFDGYATVGYIVGCEDSGCFAHWRYARIHDRQDQAKRAWCERA